MIQKAACNFGWSPYLLFMASSKKPRPISSVNMPLHKVAIVTPVVNTKVVCETGPPVCITLDRLKKAIRPCTQIFNAGGPLLGFEKSVTMAGLLAAQACGLLSLSNRSPSGRSLVRLGCSLHCQALLATRYIAKPLRNKRRLTRSCNHKSCSGARES